MTHQIENINKDRNYKKEENENSRVDKYNNGNYKFIGEEEHQI